MVGLWPGGKELLGNKYRPSYFGLRISDFGFFWFSFSIRIPQSAFRNLVAGRSGVPNSEFGMWNSEFLGFFFIPHSALYIPHFHCPPGP
jgi:hypothetical protein